jgi:TolB-like protein
MTPDGIKPAETADGEVTHSGRKTDIVIVAGLLGVLALGLWQQMTKPDVVNKDKEGTVKSALTAPQQAAIMVEPELQTDSASIAVLPFSDLSPSGDQGYFSDGIAQELLNVLAKVDGLKVASRTSAFAFKGQDALGIPFIAEKLKARNVLKGSVRKSGDMIRITAQLIDADTDMHYLPCCRSQH